METTMNAADMTLLQYWNKFKYAIAEDRNWLCRAGFSFSDELWGSISAESCKVSCIRSCSKKTDRISDCRSSRCKNSCWRTCTNHALREKASPTLHAYGEFIDRMEDALGNISISKLTFYQVHDALSAVQKAYNYAEATIRTVQSCISTVLSFAEANGDAVNVLAYTMQGDSSSTDLLVSIRSMRTKAELHDFLQKEREKDVALKKTKSLTVSQLEKLSRILEEHMEEDGRYCMMALMLYTGARPAELRALLWRDITAFLDHPGRYLIRLYKTDDENGNIKLTMKTPNAFRSIPVHLELSELLKKRRDYVISCVGKDIDDLPVCCMQNHFDTRCRAYQPAILANQVFSSKGLNLGKSELCSYMLENFAELELGENGVADKNQHLTLYVLRRNFWTWLEALTQLTDMEKRLIMGHEMMQGRKNLRPEYNDENYLWTICQKMDRCVINRRLHEKYITVSPTANCAAIIENRGIVRVCLSKEEAKAGGILRIKVHTVEPGEAICLTMPKHAKELGIKKYSVDCGDHESSGGGVTGINCEFENWLVHQNCAPRSRAKNAAKGGHAEETLPMQETVCLEEKLSGTGSMV